MNLCSTLVFILMNSQSDKKNKYINKVLPCRVLYVKMDLRTVSILIISCGWLTEDERSLHEKQSLPFNGNELQFENQYKCLSHEWGCVFHLICTATIKLDMNINLGFQYRNAKILVLTLEFSPNLLLA